MTSIRFEEKIRFFERFIMLGARTLAFLSYAAVALYPLAAARAIDSFGYIGGTLLIYVAASLLLSVPLTCSKKLRGELFALWKEFVKEPAPFRLKLALLCNCVGAICFYIGLSKSSAPAEYAIFGRLEPVGLILLAAFLLREKISKVNMLGLLVAFGASLLLLKTWEISFGAMLFGFVYVIGMSLGGMLIKQVLDTKRTSVNALLTLRTFTVTLTCFCALPFSSDLQKLSPQGFDFSSLSYAALTAVILLVIIGFRYISQCKIQLWECSAMAPFSAVVSTVILWLSGVPFGFYPATALLIIGVGETLAYLKDATLNPELAKTMIHSDTA